MARAKKNTVQDVTPPETVDTKASNTVATVDKGRHMSDLGSIIDFSEDVANAEAPATLPDGDYPAEIRAAARKTSATSGKDYGQVQFFIQPEAYPADFTDGDPDGMILTYNRVSLEDTPQGRHRMRKFLEAVGAKGGTQVNMNDWIGLTATVNVGTDEYEGEKRNVIKKVVKP